MRNQIVQWIFLPGGLTEDGHLAASIFVAPRLRSDEGQTLADFPDFVDWPALVGAGDLQITLERGDGVTEAPMQVIGGSSSALWQALFPADTRVRPFTFDDYADRPLITYPVASVLDHLQGQWARLAVAAREDLPFASFNASPIGPSVTGEMLDGHTLATHFDDMIQANRMGIFEGATNGRDVSTRLTDVLGNAAAQAAALRGQHFVLPQPLIQPFAQGATPAGHLYQLACFHRRPELEPAPFPQDAAAAQAELSEKLEFHHLLSTLGDHPELLRRLGLAFDLVIRADFLPTLTDQDAPTRVRLVIQRPSAFPVRGDPNVSPWTLDVTPWTQCRLANGPDGASFSPAEPAGGQEFAHGFVRMDPDRYTVAGVDVDGLALKALNMAVTLAAQEASSQRPVEEDARAGTPAPRTGGLGLARSGRAQALHNDFYRARADNDALENDPLNPPEMTAAQLLRGYRLDIFDGNTGTWRSLHGRRVDYLPQRNPDEQFSVDDEGYVQLSLTGEVDRPDAPADPDGALYVHETLVTWDGWSLSAPRPGQVIDQEPAPPAAAAEMSALRLGLTMRALPGSLPRLRFGTSYRVRLRTVDLAGQSHSLARANDLSSLLDASGQADYRVTLPQDEFVYRRLEPVPPPELLPRIPFSPGEGVERLVVRSNVGVSAAEYAAMSQSAADASLRFRPYCDRHVAPAKASLQLVETHGLLDEAIAAAQAAVNGDAAAAVTPFYQIAARESGSFRDHPGAQFVATGEHQGEEQGYVAIDTTVLTLPYLPDPLCAGVLIRVQLLPHEPEQRFEIAFPLEGDWYELALVRLRLTEGDMSAHYDNGERLLTVQLPPGRTARLRITSLFQQDVELFGLLDWCRNKLSPAEADSVAEAIQASEHWMTTPWRTLDLIHAVQQPLIEPELFFENVLNSVFSRKQGETAAELKGNFMFDGASTASVDLMATWDEVVDDPKLGPLDPVQMTHTARALAFTITQPEPFGSPWSPEIGHLLNAADFDETQSWQVVEFSTVDHGGDGLENMGPEAARTELLRRAGDTHLSVQERNRLAAAAVHLEGFHAHEFGDTKYRSVTYELVAATRFREYFDPQMPISAGTCTGTSVTVEMLSSAPPVAPVVLDVVPLVRWTREGAAGDAQQTSTRHNAGLRVWLARPWFSSGAGEMLGLVCSKGELLHPTSRLFREVTVMSQDPAHDHILPQPLDPDSFLGVKWPGRGVLLSTGGYKCDIAAFEPRYDAARDAWYCDIQFTDTGTYFPFVRLGLVRVQPMALPGCQLSSIVPTVFVQPLPDRSLTVVRQDATRVAVTLRGAGPRAHLGPDGAVVNETNVVAAVIEQQEAGIDDPALGWTAITDETLLTAALQGDTQVEWTGEVQVPAGISRLRLAVREFETHLADDRSGDSPILVTGRRMVHVDVVPLA